MSYKKYTSDERAEIIALLIANGYPTRNSVLAYTRSKIGVGVEQLLRWYDFPDKWCGGWYNIEVKKMELKSAVTKEVEAIFEEMNRAREKATYKDLGTVAGILLDKLLVLEGTPSMITENRLTGWKEVIERERQKYDPREETN